MKISVFCMKFDGDSISGLRMGGSWVGSAENGVLAYLISKNFDVFRFCSPRSLCSDLILGISIKFNVEYIHVQLNLVSDDPCCCIFFKIAAKCFIFGPRKYHTTNINL